MDKICGNCVYYRPKDSENGYCIMEEFNVKRMRTACFDTIAHGRFKLVEQIKEPMEERDKAFGYPISIDVTEPKKAYIIVSGEYSDFGINAVFLDKGEAERAAEIVNRRDPNNGPYDIQEWPIGLSFNPETESLYSVTFYNGEIDNVGLVRGPLLTFLKTNVVGQWNVYKYKYNDSHCCEHIIYVYARDEEHAKKIAADIFAKWKAEQEGIT